IPLTIVGIMPFNQENIPYDLTKPDTRIELQNDLLEISGLTDLNDQQVACVQDENGIIYVLDISTGKIRKKYIFGGDGDYEGITRVEKTLYILRSDGFLIEVTNFEHNLKSQIYKTGITAKNNEGLCYDPF